MLSKRPVASDWCHCSDAADSSCLVSSCKRHKTSYSASSAVMP
jgi:hypothetical protein